MKKALRGCYKIFSILLVIVTAFSMCMVHVGHVHAQETNIQGTDVSTPRDGNVMLLVNGTRRAATVGQLSANEFAGILAPYINEGSSFRVTIHSRFRYTS